MIVASYIMRCRGISSAVTPSDNFTPNDRFSVSLPRKFIFTACMISKQVIIQQMRTKSTNAKARPQNYTNKLLMKRESHYRIKERPTKMFPIIIRDQCALTVLQFLPIHRQPIITSNLLGLLFELKFKLLCFCCTNINQTGDHKSVNLINKSTAVKPAC